MKRYTEIVIIILVIAIIVITGIINASKPQGIQYSSDTTVNSYLNSLPSKNITITNNNNKALTVNVWEASTPDQLQEGLMFITNLPTDKGMLFTFPTSQQATFWMKNTLINLDMVFVDSNYKIVTIASNATPCKTANCQTYYSQVPIKYVIEVNGGWTSTNNVKVGDSVTL